MVFVRLTERCVVTVTELSGEPESGTLVVTWNPWGEKGAQWPGSKSTTSRLTSIRRAKRRRGFLADLPGGVGSRVNQLSALTAPVIYPALNVTM